MERTQSATPLEAVTVERRGPVSDVWLRRNVTQLEIDIEDGTQTVWEADECHGVLDGAPTVEYVTERFARLWAQFEEEDLTDRELVELRADALGDGLAEVAGIAAEGEYNIEVLSQAVEELAAIVGGE